MAFRSFCSLKSVGISESRLNVIATVPLRSKVASAKTSNTYLLSWYFTYYFAVVGLTVTVSSVSLCKGSIISGIPYSHDDPIVFVCDTGTMSSNEGWHCNALQVTFSDIEVVLSVLRRPGESF